MYVIDKNNLISKVGRDILDSNFGGMKLFKNESKYQARKSGSSYSQDINEFAIYLHIAQELTNLFATLHLPHPATLRLWACAGNVCEPGFLMATIRNLSGRQICLRRRERMRPNFG